MVFIQDDGRQVAFTHVGGVWESEPGYQLKLEQVDNTWEVTTKSLTVFTFQMPDPAIPGVPISPLIKITDSSGHRIDITYDEQADKLTISDPQGERSLVYEPVPNQTNKYRVREANTRNSAGDPVVRDWIVRFYPKSGNILSLKDPMSFYITFGYDMNGSLEQIADKHDQYPNVLPYYPPDVYQYQLNYGKGELIFTDPSPFLHTQSVKLSIASDPPPDPPNPSATVFPITEYTDRRGTVYRSEYRVSSTNGTLEIRGIDPTKTTKDIFDADFNLVKSQNGLGRTWQWAYDSRGNVTSATDPESNVEQWKYVGSGAYPDGLEKYTDARTNEYIYHYTYTDGTPAPTDPTTIKRIQLPPATAGAPTNVEIKFTYYTSGNKNGLPKTVTDANGVVTEYDYDNRGHMTRETEGDTGTDRVVLDYAFDEISRIIFSDKRSIGGTSAASTPVITPQFLYNLNGWMIQTACNGQFEIPPGAASGGAPNIPYYGSLEATNAVINHDRLGRVTSTTSDLFHDGSAPVNEESTISASFVYDELGRPARTTFATTEPRAHLSGNPAAVYRDHVNTFDWVAGTYQTISPDGIQAITTTDDVGRVLSVNSVSGAPPNLISISSADYGYYANSDLVERITYGNGAYMKYFYDLADRITKIQHYMPGGTNPLLELEYAYTNDLIGSITERRLGVFSGKQVFIYDNRGRLTREKRYIDEAQSVMLYDLEYKYDEGGNRTEKRDHLNSVTTTYFYDMTFAANPSGWPSWLNVPNSRANRLIGYEEKVTPSSDPYRRRVIYEYTSRSEGSVARIQDKRYMWYSDPELGPWTQADVYATAFEYNKGGELWVVTTQYWREQQINEGSIDVSIVDSAIVIREFRGSGRARYMMRDRDPNDWTQWDHASAVWTDYAGVSPTGDFTLDYSSDPNGVAVNSSHIALGMSEYDFSTGDRDYLHSNHLGSARLAMDGQGAEDWTVTYTSFGEPVSSTGVVGATTGTPSRYQYAGAWGYENLDGLDWGTPGSSVTNPGNPEEFRFPYLHTGARYYNPETGRFLQRDPIGIRGGLNVFEYVNSSPVGGVDPSGLYTPPQYLEWLPADPPSRPLFRVPNWLRRFPKNFYLTRQFFVGGACALIAEILSFPTLWLSPDHSPGDIILPWWRGWMDAGGDQLWPSLPENNPPPINPVPGETGPWWGNQGY